MEKLSAFKVILPLRAVTGLCTSSVRLQMLVRVARPSVCLFGLRVQAFAHFTYLHPITHTHTQVVCASSEVASKCPQVNRFPPASSTFLGRK